MWKVVASEPNFQNKRKWNRVEYVRLIRPIAAGRISLRMGSLAHQSSDGPQVASSIFVLRHDVDHDLRNAVRLAELNYHLGVPATFFLLHSAWYFPSITKTQRINRTIRRFFRRSIKHIQSLGHEIALHNNLVATSLRTRVAPEILLGNALEELEESGVSVQGTSSHGDLLCRRLGFRNSEWFSECVRDELGGARFVPRNGDPLEGVSLGVHSMGDFGLSYETYNFRYSRYLSDAGGHFKIRADAFGFGEHRSQSSRLISLLVHPIWWDLR